MANPGVCPCGCDIPPSRVSLHSPSEPCCCCVYDPFSDNSKESEIRDLSFALKKLAVMRCQMKKWRMERLQLESETRSLKQALQSFGVDTNVALKPDPLIVHYRQENERLQNANEELKEKLKNLDESLAERECWEDPEEEVIYVREKMKTLKEHFVAEKKQFREKISELKLKLAEAEDDTSCAALNRLRAKLRELMKNGEEADRQVADVVERSMDTMVDLSKGCEELKLDNERLYRLLKDLGISPEEIDEYLKNLADDPAIYKKTIEDSPQNKLLNLEKKLKDCEEAMKGMRGQLDEKNTILESLTKELDQERRTSIAFASDLDKVSVSYKTLMEEVIAAKTELQRKDEKISSLIRELRQSMIDLNDLNKVQREMEEVKPQLYSITVERDELLDELVKTREIVGERNDEIIKILELKAKSEKDCIAKLADMQEKMNAKLSEETNLKKDISDLENELVRLRGMTQDVEEQRALNEEYNLISELNNMKLEGDNLKKLLADEEKLKNDLSNKLDAIEIEMGNLRNENLNLANQSEELQREKERKEKVEEEIKRFESELDSARAQKEKAEKENATLTEELAKLGEKNDKLIAENESLKRKIEELDGALEALNKCKEENNSLRGRINELESINNASKEESERAKADAERIKNESIAMKDALDKMIEELDKLKDENERLKMQNDENSRLKPELENLRSANETIRKESETLKAKLNETLDELNAEKLARSNIEKELMALKNELKNLLDKIDKLKEENEALKEEKEELKKTLLKFDDDMSKLKNANWDLNKENETLKARIADFEAKIIKLEEEIDHWKTENCKINLNVEKLKGNLEKAMKDLVECQVAKKLLEQRVFELEEENSKVQKYNADILSNLDHLKKSHELDESSKEECLKDLNNTREENNSLKDELTALKAELLKLRDENKDLKISLADTMKRLTSAEAEIEQQKAEISTLRTENTSMKGEVERLKAEKEKFSGEAAKLGADLARLQNENDNLKIGQQKLEEDYGKLRGHGDGQKIEIDKLKSELAEERSNIDKLKTDLSSCRKENDEIMTELKRLKEENEKLKSQLESGKQILLDTESKLQNIEKKISEMEKEKVSFLDELKDLRSQINKLEGQLENEKNAKESAIKDSLACKEELAALKEELAKLRAETGKLQAEADTLKARAADEIKLLESKLQKEADLKLDNEKLKKDLAECNKMKDAALKEIETLRGLVAELEKKLDQCQKDTEQLRSDNDRLKNDISKTREDLKALDTINLQLKKKMADDLDASKKEIDQLILKSRLELDTLSKKDDSDFTIPIKALKEKIEQQNNGVNRLRDYIMFLLGKMEEKPKMVSFFEEEDDDFVRRLIPPFDGLIPISHELSNNIYRAEIEIQELDDLRKPTREDDVLEEKLMEDELLEEEEKPPLDVDDWLKSLTLTEMADLHDKICLLTSSMVRDDRDAPTCITAFIGPFPGQSPSQEDYDVLNKRIAALQRQITEKQMEASWKLQELKRALRFEQANLIRISDEMNLERKRNLALQLTMDDGILTSDEN
ncbi:myosin-2 heavy chain-like [Vespa crabro]|uniref:myosin-2 heavy chain-like n=1 Tax=Vespa crabro TaxID=7445 RepID=UPI001F0100C3|nr:myosin-2 heavy chain-like [Vespa crabro]